MSHYETLDVGQDASADQIKQAFRKKASAAHPDRHGGNNEQMAAVNKAYEVLGDPERRARYDETGDDDQPDSIEKRALHQLVGFFELVLEMDGNLIALVRKHMQEGEDAAANEVNNLKRKVGKLTGRRNKIKVKSGENLVHLIIDGQVKAANARIAALEDAIAVGKVARKLLEDYISEEQEPKNDLMFHDQLVEMMNRHYATNSPFGGSSKGPW